MTGRVFLDTSAWFAALSEPDTHHARTRAFYREQLRSGTQRLVTTGLVVAEMHALLSRRAGSDVALRFLDQLYVDPAHEVVAVDRALEREAIDRWLRPFQDHAFSLTDAVSFEVMRREGIDSAMTLDRHFATAGFTMIPG